MELGPAPAEDSATRTLLATFGQGEPRATAWAPGRCTLVGEHVDYAGGQVVAMAIDLGIAIAVRRSPDEVFRMISDGRRVERAGPEPVGDVGDRVFAAVIALRRLGWVLPAVEASVSASLPEGAGLASSAALTLATLTALAQLVGRTVSARDLVQAALIAERDIVGIPCGPLDQNAIVHAPARGTVLLNCATDEWSALPWPWDGVVICACDTGERHDVGGDQYRQRRAQTERALELLGVPNCQLVDVRRIASLPGVEARRARHVVEESRRSLSAADALRAGDAAGLGSIMSESHRSLRELHDVSTLKLDAVVHAAQDVPGCFGARLVGAGFGGTAIALVTAEAAEACRLAMAAAAGCGREATWVFRPAPGLAVLSPDVVAAG